MFGKAKQPVYEEQKVSYMLDNINTSNVELQAAVTLIRMDDNIKDLPTPEGYFIRAANKMAEQIAVIFPSVIGKKSRFISSIDGGQGRGRGRGRSGRFGGGGGRGGRMGRVGRNFPKHLGGRPRDTWNGVDISDL